MPPDRYPVAAPSGPRATVGWGMAAVLGGGAGARLRARSRKRFRVEFGVCRAGDAAGRGRVNPEMPQESGVDERVIVLGLQERRTAAGYGIELGKGEARVGIGELLLVPAAQGDQPLVTGQPVGDAPQPFQGGTLARDALQPDQVAPVLRPAHEMIVVVDQPRHHGAPLEIHHLRGVVGQGQHVFARARGDEPVGCCREPFDDRELVVDGDDLAVDVDDLGRRGSP